MRSLGLAVALGLACVAAGRAEDIVIFKDGYKLQGRRFKEQQVLTDPGNGVMVQIPAARGFDIMDDGPRWVIFSSNSRQLGAEISNPEQSGSGRDLDRIDPLKPAVIRTVLDLPGRAKYPPLPPFNEDWRRKFKVETGNGNFQIIEQVILKVNPKRILIGSTTHKWQIAYGTREMPVDQVRAIVAHHPSLVEDPKKPDAGRRLGIAAFFRDAGLLDQAKAELEKAKADIPGEWAKDVTERYEQLLADITRLRNTAVVDELETAVASGRYAAATGLIARFDDKIATATDAKRFSSFKATVENVTPRFDRTKRMLRDALDDLTDSGRQVPFAAVGGGGIVPFVPRNLVDPKLIELLAAGEQVYAELHPDTAGRVELFFNQAAQAEQQRKAGKGTTTPASQLVALAVTGWLLGKNGADPSADAAVKIWNYRKMLLEYQTAATQNERRAAVRKYSSGEKPSPDLLAQVISLLPPPAPAMPADGVPIPPSPQAVSGLVRKKTPPLREAAAGVEYVLRLPPEYHHGRAYPVLLAFTHPGTPAETMVSLLAADADRNGYIVAAPVWTKDGDTQNYDYKGDRHYLAMATLRSLLREYRVDNDRVFLFGFGDGGNLAMDVGLSHPDRFAGLVTMAAYPKYQNTLSMYWQNAQKLPVYTVGGNLNGAAYNSLRQMYEKWMPKGYPALWSLYRGRSLEWYGVDVPAVFDWMGRKKRVTGTASLRLNTFGVEPWQIMRETDDRFYWVGTTSVRRSNTLAENEGKSFVCAELFADVRQGNQIDIRSRGLLNVVVWLDRDMIDWTKPVSVRLNGGPPRGYKPKVIEPDVEVMLEELYKHGDRTMLFLNKLEFEAIP